MMIKRIMEDDTRNCYVAIKADSQLAELDKRFYAIADTMPEKDKLEMESIFSEYMARVIRIAYLQGMRDFTELHIILKDDVSDILKCL